MKKFYFYYGTMGCGKSLQLIAEAKNLEKKNKRFIIFNYENDKRFGENVVASRCGFSLPSISYNENTDLFKEFENISRESFKEYPLDSSSHVSEYSLKYDMKMKRSITNVFIDEAQFLKEEQVEQLVKIMNEFVICIKAYGLKTDFQNKLFEGSKALIENADECIEIQSECSLCDNKASRNMRINGGGKAEFVGDKNKIGNMYIAVCRDCYDYYKNSQSF